MSEDIESERQRVINESASLDIIHDRGRRYPHITAPSGFDKLSHLSEEEKQIGKQILHRASPTKVQGVEQPPEHAALQFINPWTAYHSDPELMAAEVEYEEVHYRLLTGLKMTTDKNVMMATDKGGFNARNEDIQRRYSIAMLIVEKVAHEYQDEWATRLMSTSPGTVLSVQQRALLDQPQSVVWDEEQRLVLLFAEGVMRRTLTDELLTRAESIWGRKQMLRYGAHITLYVRMLMFSYINISDVERLGEL